METFLFLLFGLAAAGGAVMVVLNQDVVRMAFWLIVSLASTACLFFLLGADFVGAVQLLIYVGGTVVLLIFGVMLTSSGPYLRIKSSPGEVLQAVVVGGLFLGMLVLTVMQVDWDRHESRLQAEYGGGPANDVGYNQQGEGSTVRNIGAALLGARFDADPQHPDRVKPGYLLPFEIISMHLLVVLIGAAYIARAKRKRPDSQSSSS
ncbi:MAG: NADH-quinone oxidoreductase subunit J [Planctomycetaceae bacterium]